jgi:hypothetical protein
MRVNARNYIGEGPDGPEESDRHALNPLTQSYNTRAREHGNIAVSMTSIFWLRAASAVALLYALGHALGGLQSWSADGARAVLDAMRTVEFDVMGRTRTYLDFYVGFGHTISVLLFLQAVLLWQLAGAVSRGAPAGPMLVSMFAAAVAGAAVVARFLFIVPIVMSATIAGCLAIALVLHQRATPKGNAV